VLLILSDGEPNHEHSDYQPQAMFLSSIPVKPVFWVAVSRALLVFACQASCGGIFSFGAECNRTVMGARHSCRFNVPPAENLWNISSSFGLKGVEAA
jgi:hypothetical protein